MLDNEEIISRLNTAYLDEDWNAVLDLINDIKRFNIAADDDDIDDC